MKEFYKALLNTASMAGIPVLTDDYCCRLLAWLLYLGGSYEAVVYNYLLNTDIKEAQERLNIYGGEAVSNDLLPVFKAYALELKAAYEGKTDYPEWAQRINKKYNLPPLTKIES